MSYHLAAQVFTVSKSSYPFTFCVYQYSAQPFLSCFASLLIRKFIVPHVPPVNVIFFATTALWIGSGKFYITLFFRVNGDKQGGNRVYTNCICSYIEYRISLSYIHDTYSCKKIKYTNTQYIYDICQKILYFKINFTKQFFTFYYIEWSEL